DRLPGATVSSEPPDYRPEAVEERQGRSRVARRRLGRGGTARGGSAVLFAETVARARLDLVAQVAQTRVEAGGVKRADEPERLAVVMVAEFVQQRVEECGRPDHITARRRAVRDTDAAERPPAARHAGVL